MVKIPGDKDTIQTPFIKSEPLDDEINLRPVKRRRYFMAAVEVPTLASIRNRLQNAVPTVPGGEYDERIGKFKNVCIFTHDQGMSLIVSHSA